MRSSELKVSNRMCDYINSLYQAKDELGRRCLFVGFVLVSFVVMVKGKSGKK
jgi:hypothetical protein